MSALEVATEIPLDGRISEPRLQKLHAYWAAQKAARRYPARRDIDPLGFRYVLGHVMMIDVLATSPRFRVRLHGSELVLRAGYDLTGKFLEDLPNIEYRAYVLERCANILASGEPMIVHHDRVLDGQVRRYEALWLPFSEDGGDITMLLCGLIYAPLRDATIGAPLQPPLDA
jgi:hypothetical protein